MKHAFYDVKAKKKVEAEVVEKKQFENGRYAVIGKTADGRALYCMVSKADFDKCDAKCTAAAKKCCCKKK